MIYHRSRGVRVQTVDIERRFRGAARGAASLPCSLRGPLWHALRISLRISLRLLPEGGIGHPLDHL